MYGRRAAHIGYNYSDKWPCDMDPDSLAISLISIYSPGGIESVASAVEDLAKTTKLVGAVVGREWNGKWRMLFSLS